MNKGLEDTWVAGVCVCMCVTTSNLPCLMQQTAHRLLTFTRQGHRQREICSSTRLHTVLCWQHTGLQPRLFIHSSFLSGVSNKEVLLSSWCIIVILCHSWVKLMLVTSYSHKGCDVTGWEVTSSHLPFFVPPLSLFPLGKTDGIHSAACGLSLWQRQDGKLPHTEPGQSWWQNKGKQLKISPMWCSFELIYFCQVVCVCVISPP